MKFDIIIIGAGLGGLTAGAKLSKEGKKVLVIEQHNMPGGYATTFRRGAFNVEFLRLPEFYRFVNDRVDVTVPHNPETAAEILTAQFPGETEGIKAFFNQIMNPRKNLMDPAQQGRSVGEFLDSIIGDDELKLVLLGNLGYFHDDPYSLSLAYYTVSQGSYFAGGGSFSGEGRRNCQIILPVLSGAKAAKCF